MLQKSKFQISSTGLHILAMTLMLYDHTWAMLFPAAEWLTCIGRIARSVHRKVARELCEKSYTFFRKEWYYGMKLHAVVARRPGCLPLPLSLMASGAAQHDLPATKQILEDRIVLKQGRLYADKAYIDAVWEAALKNDHTIELITPRKKRKEDSLVSGDTFSAFVSSVRQPIECFFNWLNRLPAIQSASTVRSLSGLLLLLFGRIAEALVSLIFNP